MQRRTLPFIATRGLTQKEAKAYCLVGWGLSKDVKRHHRWQIVERSSGRSFSKTFLMSSSQTDDGALAFVLRKAWQVHVADTGAECPYVFSDALVPAE